MLIVDAAAIQVPLIVGGKDQLLDELAALTNRLQSPSISSVGVALAAIHSPSL